MSGLIFFKLMDREGNTRLVNLNQVKYIKQNKTGSIEVITDVETGGFILHHTHDFELLLSDIKKALPYV